MKRAGQVVAVVFLTAIILTSQASPAQADNCSGLSDCFFTIAGALVVTAALALLIRS